MNRRNYVDTITVKQLLFVSKEFYYGKNRYNQREITLQNLKVISQLKLEPLSTSCFLIRLTDVYKLGSE